MKNQDDFLRELAARYAEHYGQELREELQQLEKSKVVYHTGRLDRRVRKQVGLDKSRRYIRGIALLAACVALVLFIPRILPLSRSGTTTAPSAGEMAEAPAAAPEEAWDDDEPFNAVHDNSAAEADSGGAMEIIPLSFSLPSGFSVADVEQDNEKSIYYLDNAMLDDVVMTLEYTPDDLDLTGLVELDIHSTPVYAADEPDYSLLTFENENILYTLTCRYDINTLVELGGYIL